MVGRLRSVNPSLLAIMAEGFFSRLSFGFITFALPLYAFRELGLGLTGVGILLSFNLMVAIVLKPPLGAVADRFGFKQSLTTAIGMRTLVSLLLPLAAVAWQLFAIRGLHGVSIALRDPAVNALIAEHSAKRAIASTFAWYQTAKSVAGAAGKFLAGVLLSLTAANFTLVFLVAGGLSVVPLLVVAAFLRNPQIDADELTGAAALARPEPAVEAAAAAERGQLGREPAPARPRIAPFMGLGFLISGTAYMLANLFPLLAVEYAGLTEAQTGAIYGLSTIVVLSGPGFGWLSDHVSHRLVMSVRSVANVVSSVIYWVAPNLVGMAAGRTLDDMGKAAFRPAWGALMAQVSSYDRRRRARTMGYLTVGEDAGEVAGPVLAGFLWSTWGVPALLGVRIGMSVLTEIYTIAVTGSLHGRGRRRVRRADSQTELVRRAIDAFNRGDAEAIARYVHPDAEAFTFVVLRADTPFGARNGVVERVPNGPAGLPALLGSDAELGQEMQVESLELVDGQVLGLGRLVLRGRGRRAARTVDAAWVWETRGGKVTYMGFYLDPREAMRAVGRPRDATARS